MSTATTKRARSIVGSGGDRQTEDFYPTPPLCTRELLRRESFPGFVDEPACGNGAICKVFAEMSPESAVHATDLVDRGWGFGGVDYLTRAPMIFDHVVTNPPFKLAERFVYKALGESTGKVAMFLKLTFLSAECRVGMFRNTPLRTVYVFAKRPTLAPGDCVMQNGGMIDYAWYVWERGYEGKPTLDWISAGDSNPSLFTEAG
jgi:hypothetical protein